MVTPCFQSIVAIIFVATVIVLPVSVSFATERTILPEPVLEPVPEPGPYIPEPVPEPVPEPYLNQPNLLNHN